MSTSRRMEVTLDRGLGLFDVTMIGVGAMIGAGIFGLTGIAAGRAGPVGLLLAFALNGVVTTLTGLTYAELGAAIPEAGGGYLWVREGMSRFWGFFAGWISWFSHSVACSLYAVIFGSFFIELVAMGGIEFGQDPILFGFSGMQIAERLVTVGIIILFLMINVRGASETGTVGNIITIFKIVVLMALVFFGIRAMLNVPNWTAPFNDPSPLPNGIGGVLVAMGLTFVAFEGYEIIAQSGEELVNPERNLPRAIFYSIAVVVVVYLLVAFVSIGALVQDSGLPNWVFLGQNAEKAMIRTAEAIMPYGAFLMILGGLASTTSALNATIYSSSRVSFAMGRGGDLPGFFGRVHRRNRTPVNAINVSGVLIIVMAVLLPVEDVAGGASLTFLLLFLLTNLSLIQLRKKQPDLKRTFRVPWVPWLPIITIAVQGVLMIGLFDVSWIAWASAIIWTALGIIVYFQLGAQEEAALEADMILLEETIASRGYSLMLPVASAPEARQLARLAAPIAQQYGGEVFALHVVRVPQQLELSSGRAFLKYGRPLLEEVINIGQEYDVPVRTQIRLGRHIGRSILEAARSRDADLIMLGWPGSTDSPERAFGSVIDLISASPPCDIAMVRLQRGGLPKRFLVPVSNGENTQLALDIALAQADYATSQGEEVEVVALHLVSSGSDPKDIEETQRRLIDGLTLGDLPVELRVMPSDDIVEDILNYSEGFDEIVIGASEERLLEQQLFGSIPQQIAEEALTNVIVVKRYNPIKHGLFSKWLYRARRNGWTNTITGGEEAAETD